MKIKQEVEIETDAEILGNDMAEEGSDEQGAFFNGMANGLGRLDSHRRALQLDHIIGYLDKDGKAMILELADNIKTREVNP